MKIKLASATLTALMVVPAVQAQEWPTQPITMVVPFAPGGVADTVARPVAEAMSRYLKQTVVVENKAGSGGGLGIAQVGRAAPTGYTILISLPSISSMPTADRIIGRKPLYQLEQLVPIARITADPTVLTVRADSPWKTIEDLIESARKKPVSYGSSGIYGTLHMYMESFANAAKLQTLHVPYGGAGPALIGLLGSQVDALAASPATVKQHVDKGTLRVLAHWGDEPIDAFPTLPSLKSKGYDLEFYQWSGLFAPKGTPEPVLKKLREAAKFAIEDAQTIKTINGAGLPIKYLDAPEFQTYWDNDAKNLNAAVERVGKVD